MASEYRYLASKYWYLELKYQYLDSKYQYLASKFWNLVTKSQYLVSKYWYLISKFWYLVSKYWYLVSKYWYGWYSLDLHLEVFGFVSTLAGIEPPLLLCWSLASATTPNESSLKVWCSLLTTWPSRPKPMLFNWSIIGTKSHSDTSVLEGATGAERAISADRTHTSYFSSFLFSTPWILHIAIGCSWTQYDGWYSLDLHLEVFGFVSTLAGIEPPPLLCWSLAFCHYAKWIQLQLNFPFFSVA